MPEATGKHRCPHPSCHRMVPGDLFACSQHWCTLPREIRSSIYAAWYNRSAEAHRQATRKAMDHWVADGALL